MEFSNSVSVIYFQILQTKRTTTLIKTCYGSVAHELDSSIHMDGVRKRDEIPRIKKRPTLIIVSLGKVDRGSRKSEKK